MDAEQIFKDYMKIGSFEWYEEQLQVEKRRIAELEENARLSSERVHQLHDMYDKARELLRKVMDAHEGEMSYILANHINEFLEGE